MVGLGVRQNGVSGNYQSKILWGTRASGTNVDPTSTNPLAFTGVGSGTAYATINSAGPTNSTDLVTKSYADSHYILSTGATPSITGSTSVSITTPQFTVLTPTSLADISFNDSGFSVKSNGYSFADQVSGNPIFSFGTQSLGQVNMNLWPGHGDGTSGNMCNFVVQTREYSAPDVHWIQILGSNPGSAAPVTGDSLNIGAGRNGTGGSLSVIPLTITNDGGAAHGDGSQIILQPAAEIQFADTAGTVWMDATPTATTFTGGQVVFPTYVKASLPTGIVGGQIYVSDATSLTRTGAMCWFDGSTWIDFATNATVV